MTQEREHETSRSRDRNNESTHRARTARRREKLLVSEEAGHRAADRTSRQGYKGIDIAGDADIIWDLNETPWPIKTTCVERGFLLSLREAKLHAPKKLDIACGQNKQKGFKGIDIAGDADIFHDLNEIPWPIKSNSVEQVFCSHFVEHIPHWRPGWEADGWFSFFDELYRVMKPDATAEFIHPYVTSVRAFWDPTHVRYIHEVSWHYLNVELANRQRPRPLPGGLQLRAHHLQRARGLRRPYDAQPRAAAVPAPALLERDPRSRCHHQGDKGTVKCYPTFSGGHGSGSARTNLRLWAETLLAGDRRVFHETIRRHPPGEDEDDEDVIVAFILSQL